MSARLARVEKAHRAFLVRLAKLETERKRVFEDTLKQLDAHTIEEIMTKLNAKSKPAA